MSLNIERQYFAKNYTSDFSILQNNWSINLENILVDALVLKNPFKNITSHVIKLLML